MGAPPSSVSLTSRGAVGRFVWGLQLVPRAAWRIVTTPKLLGIACLCALVTAAVLIGSAAALWSLTGSFADGWIGHDDRLHDVLAAIAHVIFFIVAFPLVALTLPNLVLAPLQDPLSIATEASLGPYTSPPFSFQAMARGIGMSLTHTALRLAIMLVGLGLLFPLNLIPAAGNVLWAVLGTTWSSFFLAVEHLSGPMARHLYPFGLVVRVLRKQLSLALGFGLSLYVMLWVPVVNFFLLPVAVVAGTLLYRALLADDALQRE